MNKNKRGKIVIVLDVLPSGKLIGEAHLDAVRIVPCALRQPGSKPRAQQPRRKQP